LENQGGGQELEKEAEDWAVEGQKRRTLYVRAISAKSRRIIKRVSEQYLGTRGEEAEKMRASSSNLRGHSKREKGWVNSEKAQGLSRIRVIRGG